MPVCAACEATEPVTGWLCEECAAAIHGATAMFPEQITTTARASDAILLDRWGRSHALAPRTVIGRQQHEGGLAIMQARVSRFHAELLRKRDGSWWIVDLASSNGTTVNDEPVSAPRAITTRSSVFFGEVGFFFITPSPGPAPTRSRLPTTHRPPPSVADEPLPKIYDEGEDERGRDPGEAVATFSGFATVEISFAAPTGGGGGVVEVDRLSVQLTEVQYQLVQVLAQRMEAEEGRDERVRGFVRSTELLATLPWDTPRPEDNHIKQLVRRVRRTLVRAGMGDLIESRQGFGYRLRVRVRLV